MFKYESLFAFYCRVLGMFTKSSVRIGLRDEMSQQAERYWIYKSEIDYLKEVSFEVLKVPVPRLFDDILKRIYGDYMKFPPEEERGIWHEGMITFDPDVSYKEKISASI
jgi:lipopolysaccharide cholinephosphotransferase